MNAYTWKSQTKDGDLAKHYIGKKTDDNIIVAQRILIPVKDFERYDMSGWNILKVYKEKALIEIHLAFLPDTASFISDAIHQLLNHD